MRLLLTLLLVAASLAGGETAQARGPRRRIFQVSAVGASHRLPPPVDARELYPKYDGGFHARALQDIGIPAGDRGIRGNGIYANPW